MWDLHLTPLIPISLHNNQLKYIIIELTVMNQKIYLVTFVPPVLPTQSEVTDGNKTNKP